MVAEDSLMVFLLAEGWTEGLGLAPLVGGDARNSLAILEKSEDANVRSTSFHCPASTNPSIDHAKRATQRQRNDYQYDSPECPLYMLGLSRIV